jgi:site-specific recombinase XerD
MVWKRRSDKTEVQAELVRIKAQLDEDTYFEPSRMALKNWLNKWLSEYMRNSIKEQTFNTYEMVINKIIAPIIGDVALKNLTPLMLQQTFNKLNEKYKPSTIRKIKSILNMAFGVARNNELIAKDPLSGLKLPKLKKPEIESMAVCDIHKFLDAAQESSIYNAVMFGLGTGVRIGELLALNWPDFDFLNAEVSITKTLIRSKDKNNKEILKVQDSVKTDRSFRTVPLNRDIITMLKTLKKKRLAEGFNDNNIVFCSQKGTHMSPRNFNRVLKSICNKAGIKKISANVTRHTFATVAVERKAEIKTISEILGHRRIETTYNNYVHPSNEKKKQVAELMVFSPTDKKTE